MPKKPIYTSPQDAETAFYEALERGDVETMMSVWAEDEEIICVHPGGPRLAGYAMVREGWRHIFDSGTRLRVQLLALTTVHGPFSAIHSVIEQVAVVGEQQMAAPVAATNVYVRGTLGWRMILHHASAVPPDSVDEIPQILH